RIASKPANSPCDPALGCSDTAAKPVISASHSSSCLQISMYPTVCSPGANGCNLETSGHEIGNIAAVAVDFIVHEPSGIIDVVSERSRDSSFLMYRNISVSVWCVLKTGWLRKCEVRPNIDVSSVPPAPKTFTAAGPAGFKPAGRTGCKSMFRSAKSQTCVP